MGVCLLVMAASASAVTRAPESKDDLRKFLASDWRRLIVSMIHRFDRMPANLSDRENVFVLIDEAHWTTGGELGSDPMRSAA